MMRCLPELGEVVWVCWIGWEAGLGDAEHLDGDVAAESELCGCGFGQRSFCGG